MRRPIPGLYPSGGWCYRHEDGTLITARSRDELSIRVGEYFIRIGHETETLENRIDEFICKSRPVICRDDSWIKGAVRQNPEGALLASKMQAYLNTCVKTQRLTTGGLPRVDPEVARQRAEICRKCPANRDWTKSCHVCEQGVKVAAKTLAEAGPKVDVSSLKACSHFGYHLGTAVRIAFRTFDDTAPEQCWRRPS